MEEKGDTRWEVNSYVLLHATYPGGAGCCAASVCAEVRFYSQHARWIKRGKQLKILIEWDRPEEGWTSMVALDRKGDTLQQYVNNPRTAETKRVRFSLPECTFSARLKIGPAQLNISNASEADMSKTECAKDDGRERRHPMPNKSWKNFELRMATRFGTIREGATGDDGADFYTPGYSAYSASYARSVPLWLTEAVRNAVRNATGRDG